MRPLLPRLTGPTVLVWLALRSYLQAASGPIPLPLGLEDLRQLSAAARDGAGAGAGLELAARLGDAGVRAKEAGDAVSEAYARAGLAALDEWLGRWRRSEEGVRQAATAEAVASDPLFGAQVALWLADESLLWQRPDRARQWARVASGQFRAAGHRAGQARALHVEASATLPGDARRRLLEEAINAAREGGNALDMAVIQSSLGEQLRADGNLSGAIGNLRQATETLQALGARRQASRSLTLLARSYTVHGNSKEALVLLKQAGQLLELEPESEEAASVRLELARVLASVGERARALATFDRVRRPAGRTTTVALAHGYLSLSEYQATVAVVEEYLRPGPRIVPPVLYWFLSAAQFHLGRYADSVESATSCIVKSGGGGIAAVSAYRWRARSLDRMGRNEEAARDMLEVARLGRTVLDRLAPDDEWKRGFAENKQQFADDMVAVLWRAGKRVDALRTAEMFRSRAFRDLLASRNSESGTEWKLPDSGQPRLSSDTLAGEVTPAMLSAHAASAPATLLSYYVHPEGVYVWVVGRDGEIQSAFTPVPEARLERLVDRARRLGFKPDREAWRALYRLLLQPARRWLPTGGRISDLTILPHGPLLQVPFGALLAPSGRYLLEDYAVRVAPAAVFLAAAGAAVPGPFLLVGAPAGLDKALPPLPGAARELDRVAALAGGQSRLLRGADATEVRLREQAPTARVLHFATHAVMDQARPFQSFLALSHQSRLTAGRIYELRLNADLVMLTACQAGSGKVSADGLLGFTRAFLYAGAASVVAPLWDIPDGPSLQRVVEEFYRQYRNGVSKSRALRTAQLQLLDDLRAGRVTASTAAGPMPLPEHPGLWAGFVLQGTN